MFSHWPARWQIHRPIYCAAIALLCFAASAIADVPATQPTTAPSSDITAIKSCIRQLGDDDPLVRDAATEQLMGLSDKDLPALRSAAKSMAPLVPAQTAALHDIVTDVYLSPDAMANIHGFGFLGLRWPNQTKPYDSRGILIVERIPGFDVYRMLRNADVIIKLTDFPNTSLQYNAINNIDPHSAFTEAVRGLSPGQTLRMVVLRGGQTIQVSVIISARPREFEGAEVTTQRFLDDRIAAAQDYWKANFAAIECKSVTPSSP